jgi:hypothetical protein
LLASSVVAVGRAAGGRPGRDNAAGRGARACRRPAAYPIHLRWREFLDHRVHAALPGDLYGHLVELSTGVPYADFFVRPFIGEELPTTWAAEQSKPVGRHTISTDRSWSATNLPAGCPMLKSASCRSRTVARYCHRHRSTSWPLSSPNFPAPMRCWSTARGWPSSSPFIRTPRPVLPFAKESHLEPAPSQPIRPAARGLSRWSLQLGGRPGASCRGRDGPTF